MTDDPNEVVRAARGPLIQIELWERVLKEAGIDSKVVGNDLSAGFGTAVMDSVELWVRLADLPAAMEAIGGAEVVRGQTDIPDGQIGEEPTS